MKPNEIIGCRKCGEAFFAECRDKPTREVVEAAKAFMTAHGPNCTREASPLNGDDAKAACYFLANMPVPEYAN